jgi:hypothetical protein
VTDCQRELPSKSNSGRIVSLAIRVPAELTASIENKRPDSSAVEVQLFSGEDTDLLEVSMFSAYWNLIIVDFGFIGAVTAAIALFTIALARKEDRERRSTQIVPDQEILRRAS